MSEQKPNFMASLDEWTDKEVFGPLFEAFELGKSGAIADAQSANSDSDSGQRARQLP